MIAFILIVIGMTAVAVAAVLVPLVRHRAHGGAKGQAASNVDLIRDQLTELDRDRASGVLAAEQYNEARAELERRVLDEAVEEGETARGIGMGTVVTAAIVPVVIVLAAGLLYWQLGSPSLLGAERAAAVQSPEHSVSPEQIEAMVNRLEQRLKDNPNDARGWSVLARTYYRLERFPDAVRAFEHLVQLEPDDPDTLADYADALGMAHGRELAGKPMELVRKALRIDPNHAKALAMAGSEAFDRRDYKTALVYWEKLQKVVPPDSPFGQSVGASIAEARQLAGMPPAKPVETAGASSASAARVKVVVSLSPALAAKASPDDTVFIFARPSEGPKMPLAVVRKVVSELPATVTLDDTQAMSPAMKLSSFPQVVIGARVSKSASATPQSGDLEGLSPTVAVGADVKVVIDRVLP